jgi:c-di-GMP-binding flagellar brake protein YcgR
MKTLKKDTSNLSMIERAIQEKLSISVSLKTKLRSSIYSSRFLAVNDEQIILKAPPTKVIDPYDPVLEVLITFCHAPTIYSFNAKWLGEQTFLDQDGRPVLSLVVSLPAKIRQSQRRNYERVVVEEGTYLQACFWFPGDIRNRYFGLLHDISLDGVGIEYFLADEAIEFQNNQQCTIGIYPTGENESIIIPARYRHREKLPERKFVLLGFQFELSIQTIENSKKLAALNQLIAHLQSSQHLDLALR